MRFDVPRKEFFEAVSAAASAASVRTSLNILQNLKIDALDGGVRVTGCDGEMWVQRDVACLVTEPGAVCVQARLLNDLVSSMPDGDITFRSLEQQGVLMSQGASEYRMLSLDAADFPDPPDFGGEGELNLPMGLLRQAVDSVIFAASSENHRPILTGALFNYDGSTLTLVATDSHRLAVRKIEQAGIGSNINVVVPEKALKAIKAVPVPDGENVQVRFGKERIGVETSNSKVVAQLIAGTFPNWERVVPSEVTRSWKVESDQLMDKVKRTMILARDNANRVRFKGTGDEQILLSAHSDEKGEAKEELAMIGHNGDVEIAFNGKFVQDALGPISGPGVLIEMTESSRPAIFRSVEDDNGYFCVIMPMHIV
jgi:DNA polymerase-3 subunit beta